MDDLNFLPTKETTLSPQEDEILSRFFSSPNKQPTSPDQETNMGWMTTLKITAVSLVAFIVVCNPFIDTILSKLPFLNGNSMMLLILKSFIFCVLTFMMIKFLV